jgi:hypothetical protein
MIIFLLLVMQKITTQNLAIAKENTQGQNEKSR